MTTPVTMYVDNHYDHTLYRSDAKHFVAFRNCKKLCVTYVFILSDRSSHNKCSLCLTTEQYMYALEAVPMCSANLLSCVIVLLRPDMPNTKILSCCKWFQEVATRSFCRIQQAIFSLSYGVVLHSKITAHL